MLVQLPRLANSLRDRFDPDKAYLERKTILQYHLRPRKELEPENKLLGRWKEASAEVRKAYQEFIREVWELVDREIPSEELHDVASAIYDLFESSNQKEDNLNDNFSNNRSKLQKLIGHAVSNSSLSKIGGMAQKLSGLQPSSHGSKFLCESHVTESCANLEFGSDLFFQAPSRFLADNHLGDEDMLSKETSRLNNQRESSSENFNLFWLKDVCGHIVKESSSKLSCDDLAMAICRVLDTDKPGDEVANDLLDLVGDCSFGIIQDLILHRSKLVDAIHHGLFVLKSQKISPNSHTYMPSYGTQVTVQTESERQIDKLRRKEEKRHKRGMDHLVANDALIMSFSSLLHASERKNPLDNLIDSGSECPSVVGSTLPKGTARKYYHGYEEVIIPPAPTAEMKPGEKLIEIEELDEFAQAAFHGYKSLNRIQSQIFRKVYYTNENILVCAPTGAGKTNIAMISILHEMAKHFNDGYLHKDEFKIVYVAPMKALAAEVTSTFSHRLCPLNMTVRELTGDMQLSKSDLEKTQMIVTTPEKWDVITRKSSDMSLSMLVKLLIIDEVHLLNDDRGPVIEALVARTLRQVEYTQTMIRIVGLSATLPNYLEVAQFLRVNVETGLFFFDSSYRPVPLAQQYIGISEQNFVVRNDLQNEICYRKVVDSLRQGHQTMVFVHSRKDTAKTAEKLLELARKYDDLGVFRNDAHHQFSLIKKEVMKSRNKDLVHFFEHGFGIHHAGMLRADRGLTERIFADGLVKVLVCTATLAWGVNLPAHTVVIKGTQIFDSKAGGWRDLGMLDVMQIFGRAGRPQFDKSGEGIIITSHDKLNYYLRLLTSQLPIESQFVRSLKDNLNAEVVLGTVTNIQEACMWLGYTYLCIRMRKNPLEYGIGWDEVLADPSLSSKQRSLITDAARALDKAKMMRFDEKSGNFYCTELGRIASHFYIQYTSVETYNERLRHYMNDSEVIDMVARSSEFENIAVREEEQNELETLLRTSCPVEVKGEPSDRHGKIAILIQAHISRGSISTFSLVSDLAYLSASLGRIMRALFEICLRNGWSEMSFFMLDYCKAVDHQIWPHQHPLRQFDRELSFEILKKLEERRLSLDRLLEMEEKEIGALIHHSHAGKLVKECLRYYPCIQLSANVSPITRTVLKVDLVIHSDFTWKDRFHGAVQRWWILVDDSENDYIYHSELFTLTKKMALGNSMKLSFPVPIFEPHPPQYYIRAVSDSWLSSEAFYPISFRNLSLPESHTSHTELLDLKPLPVTSLRNVAYESLYNFTHFNPIQTQIFHVLYHTDANVLLGAPTGSGKTISAELAMFRLFNTHPDMKVIYIAPMKAIVRERIFDWKSGFVSQLGKRMVEMTGDHTPDVMSLLSADIIVSTPEKWDGISRNWHNRNYVKKVGLVILDEIHLLGGDRGPILEVIVSRMRYISSQTELALRFIGLSTALANARDLADWLGVGDEGLFNFKPSVRPVPLEVHIQGYPGKYYCPRMNSMNKPAYAAICTHSPTKPVLIFVSSRRQTRLTALDIIQFATSDDHTRKFLSMPEESLQQILSQLTDLNLKHTLQFGIGIHHAGLNERDKSVVEELFSNNKIQVLVCTTTLAWGVNLPAHLVIIKGTEYYDAKTKRYVDFPITDILQMMGRAGRPQYDQYGKAVVLVHEPKKSFYKKFLYEPFPVESSLREQLHDHINAEIVSGTICNKRDAVYYFTWTYFFRRLMINPAYYGLDRIEDGHLSSYLSRLVNNSFENLEDSGCIKIDEEKVEPMMLGMIASQYYLSYLTVSMFGSNLGPDISLEILLHILSAASEYDELPVRHNEENYNRMLSEKVRYLVDKNQLDDPHVKANLLFQAHFSNLNLPVSDYVTDLKSVLDQSIRIIQAMIDICANSGWLSSSITCMHLLQMVMQGLWFDKDSSLWMLPCMNNDLVEMLAGKGIFKVPQLLELPKETLGLMVGNLAPNLYMDLHHFPSIQLNLMLKVREANNNEGNCGKFIALSIKLKKKTIYQKNTSRAFTPQFPKQKDEAWWLILGNISTSELHALKRVSFKEHEQHITIRMDLPSTLTNFKGLNLIMVSDCYLGFEQEHPIEHLFESHLATGGALRMDGGLNL